jgi:glycerophosphoryl diester phosphodiesterase
MISPTFIAHRGFTLHYPENTLVAVEAALKAGARFIEIDIQLTADRVPVLFHDPDLQRITGKTGCIHDISFNHLKSYRACEPERFGELYKDIPILSLDDYVTLMGSWSEAWTFVEIKTQSLERFGIQQVIPVVMETITPVKDRCILISYNETALRFARKYGVKKIGWVLTTYDEASGRIAASLNPDYLFCNYIKIPPPPAHLWTGPWSWALYEVTDVVQALALADRGVDFIETMNIGGMLRDPLVQNRMPSGE